MARLDSKTRSDIVTNVEVSIGHFVRLLNINFVKIDTEHVREHGFSESRKFNSLFVRQ